MIKQYTSLYPNFQIKSIRTYMDNELIQVEQFNLEGQLHGEQKIYADRKVVSSYVYQDGPAFITLGNTILKGNYFLDYPSLY